MDMAFPMRLDSLSLKRRSPNAWERMWIGVVGCNPHPPPLASNFAARRIDFGSSRIGSSRVDLGNALCCDAAPPLWLGKKGFAGLG